MADTQKHAFELAGIDGLAFDVSRILYDLRQVSLASHQPELLTALDDAIGFLQGAELSLRYAAKRCGK
jgi:hypothetical protein